MAPEATAEAEEETPSAASLLTIQPWTPVLSAARGWLDLMETAAKPQMLLLHLITPDSGPFIKRSLCLLAGMV